jgi:hypothetical protein
MLDKFWGKMIQLLYAFVKSYAEQHSLDGYSETEKAKFTAGSDVDIAEKRRNPPQRAITARDISRFVDIVTEYNSVKAERYNCVSFQKNVNGMATIITVHSCGKRTLSLKTMFIEI